MCLHLLEDFPHGLVSFGPGEGPSQPLELDDGGSVREVVSSSPIEETQRLSAGFGAGSEDPVDELRFDGDSNLVETRYHLHLLEDFPHGLVFFGQSEGPSQLLELDSDGSVRGVVSSPTKETQGLGAGFGAGSEDPVDELKFDRDSHLVESSLHVEIALDDVGDVVV